MAVNGLFLRPDRTSLGQDTPSVVSMLGGLRGKISLTASSGIVITQNAIQNSITIALDPTAILPTTGGTITGDLILAPSAGHYGLAIASLGSDPSTPRAGTIYFNNVDKTVRFYDGTQFLQIAYGNVGLTIVHTDSTLTVNSVPANNFSQDCTLRVNQGGTFTWTGVHTFSQPIVFPNAQTISFEQIVSSVNNATARVGAIQNGTSLLIPTGTLGQVLIQGSTSPQWSDVIVLPTTPSWALSTLAYTLFNASGTSNTSNLVTINNNKIIHQIAVKVPTGFAGVTPVTMALEYVLTTSGTVYTIVQPFDISTPTAADYRIFTIDARLPSGEASATLRAKVSSAQNLSSLSAGSIQIWLSTSIPV